MSHDLSPAVDRLAKFCQRNHLPWDDATRAGFTTYIELLLHFNRAMNLIGPLNASEIVDQLLVDSVAAAAVCAPDARTPNATLLDVGSGAGLPGIPLKLLYPDTALTLVEPRAKRTTFLKIAVERLALTNVTIARCRLEDLAPERFDYVISKAFCPPLTWLETAAGWVAPGGHILCLTRPTLHDDLRALAQSLALELRGYCADLGDLGAAVVGEKRAIFAFGAYH